MKTLIEKTKKLIVAMYTNVQIAHSYNFNTTFFTNIPEDCKEVLPFKKAINGCLYLSETVSREALIQRLVNMCKDLETVNSTKVIFTDSKTMKKVKLDANDISYILQEGDAEEGDNQYDEYIVIHTYDKKEYIPLHGMIQFTK